MKINILSGKVKKTASTGDVKTCKDGVFIRQQTRHNGSFLVSNGKPVFHWLLINSKPPEGFKGRAVIEYKN